MAAKVIYVYFSAVQIYDISYIHLKWRNTVSTVFSIETKTKEKTLEINIKTLC